MKGSPSKSEELKEKGNQCLKEEKYAEAILHYTHAISSDRENSILYSNRSMAFLKMDQFYLAYEDAKETIRLNPEWAKGYYRKAEVEFKAEHYEEAMESFRKSLQFGADEPKVLDQLRKAKRELERQIRVDNQIPWVGAATGFVLGVLLVVFDVGIREQPFLVNPLWMTLVVMGGISGLLCSCPLPQAHTAESTKKPVGTSTGHLWTDLGEGGEEGTRWLW
ncbi:hypothetical protein MTO96_014622 [Rhipicephalus appendiculatus]